MSTNGPNDPPGTENGRAPVEGGKKSEAAGPEPERGGDTQAGDGHRAPIGESSKASRDSAPANENRGTTGAPGDPEAGPEPDASAQAKKPASEAGGVQGGDPPPAQAGGSKSSGRPREGLDIWSLLKFLLGSTTAVAYLIAFGFLSEGAAFQFLGLPQLQADTFEMAEQGARNLIASFGAMGTLRSAGLLLIAVLVAWVWSRRDGSTRIRRWLLDVRKLQWAQLAVVAVTFVLLTSLVELRVLVSPDDQSTLAQRIQDTRRVQQLRWNWNPSREYARVEAQDFEVGFHGLTCRGIDRASAAISGGLYPWLPDALIRAVVLRPWDVALETFCFAGADYEPRRENMVDDAVLPFGIGKRHTLEARKAARNVFGWLFAAVIVVVISVYLLILWRRWLYREWARHGVPREIMDARRAKRSQGRAWDRWVRWLPPGLRASRKTRDEDAPRPVGATSQAGFHHASRRFVEPLMAILALMCLALLPSAYGMLARGSVGMQQVLVRLDNVPECVGAVSAERMTGAGRHLLSGSGLSVAATDALKQSRELLLRDGPQAAKDPGGFIDQVLSGVVRLEQGTEDIGVERTTPMTCNRNELLGIESAIESYQAAWTALIQAHPANRAEYDGAAAQVQLETDAVVEAVSGAECPEAYVRLWEALPRIGHFSTRLESAQYVWERWTELQRTESLVRFGYLVSYPRGSHSRELLLGDLLSRPVDGGPIRIILQPVKLECALGIEPVPDLSSSAIRRAVQRIYSDPVAARLDTFDRYPGPAALAAMLRIHEDGILGQQANGVLLTKIGTMAGLLREADPLLHQRAVELLVAGLGTGMGEMRPASGAGAPPAAALPDRRRRDSAAHAATIATSLRLAGGTVAAVRVAGLVCDSARPDEVLRDAKPAGPEQHVASESEELLARYCDALGRHGLWPLASGGTRGGLELDPSIWNQLGTLVTTSGTLASDAHAAASMSADAVAPGRNGFGDERAGHACRSVIGCSAGVLDTALAQIVRGAVVSEDDGAAKREDDIGTTRIHTASNGRAACTALGQSGGKQAQDVLDRLISDLLRLPGETLLAPCLVQAPAGLSQRLRNDLRGVVEGRWPETNGRVDPSQAIAGHPARSDQESPPSHDLRRIALGELWEAGIYTEARAVLVGLRAEHLPTREFAAMVLEDVNPDAILPLLMDCALSASTSAENSSRCLRAIRLTSHLLDGDDTGASRTLIRQFDAKVSELQQAELCLTLREFADRNGSDARTWLQSAPAAATCGWDLILEAKPVPTMADCRSVVLTSEATSIPDLAVKLEGDPASCPYVLGKDGEWGALDQQQRWRLHVAAFAYCERTDGCEAGAGMHPIFALAKEAEGGNSEARDALVSIVLNNPRVSLEQREMALRALASIDYEHAAVPAPTLLRETTPTTLVLFAAQYIEDGEPEAAMRTLGECVGDANLALSVRRRCLLGMALTPSTFTPSADSTRRVLEAAAATPELRGTACGVQSEFQLREPGPEGMTACASGLLVLPGDPGERWRSHILAMLDLLVAERMDHGRYPEESEEEHQTQLQALEDVRAALMPADEQRETQRTGPGGPRT